MSKLKVKRSESDTPTTVKVKSGVVKVTTDALPFDLSDYTDAEIMVGQQPVKDDDTPAEEFKTASDAEITNTLIGVLRAKGYGVNVVRS